MILVDRVRRLTGGLIHDEQGGFRAGRGCVDQHNSRYMRKHKRKTAEYMGFIDLEKVYDRVNMEFCGKC